VPAAAVRQVVQTLFILIWCKGYVGCFGLNLFLNFLENPRIEKIYSKALSLKDVKRIFCVRVESLNI